jgi:hypothetical protein
VYCLGSPSGKKPVGNVTGENYVNEQTDVGKDVSCTAYGAAKYERLAQLKAQFDPSNRFLLNQNIEPRRD